LCNVLWLSHPRRFSNHHLRHVHLPYCGLRIVQVLYFSKYSRMIQDSVCSSIVVVCMQRWRCRAVSKISAILPLQPPSQRVIAHADVSSASLQTNRDYHNCLSSYLLPSRARQNQCTSTFTGVAGGRNGLGIVTLRNLCRDGCK
jgi:hypothetical protein